MFEDPAKRQYLILSAILGCIISLLINFAFISVLEGSFLYGFPISLDGASGIGAVFAKLINSLIIGAILTAPIYYFMMKYVNRGDY